MSNGAVKCAEKMAGQQVKRLVAPFCVGEWLCVLLQTLLGGLAKRVQLQQLDASQRYGAALSS